MGTVRMDAAAVRALAERVLDGADRLDEIRWPTPGSDLVGSSVSAAAASPALEDHLADVVARMRTWAAAVRAGVSAIEQADLRHGDRLGGPR